MVAAVVDLGGPRSQGVDGRGLQVREHRAVELGGAIRFVDAELGRHRIEAQLDPFQENRMVDRNHAFDGGLGAPAQAPIRGDELELLATVALDRRVDLVEQLEELQRLPRGHFFRRPCVALRGPRLEVRDPLRVVVESNGERRPVGACRISLLREVRRARRVVPVRQ